MTLVKTAYPNVAMHDEAHAEDAVEQRRGAAAREEGGGGEGHEGRRQEALEDPVVRAVGLGWRRVFGRVVRGALVDGCRRSSVHTSTAIATYK